MHMLGDQLAHISREAKKYSELRTKGPWVNFRTPLSTNNKTERKDEDKNLDKLRR